MKFELTANSLEAEGFKLKVQADDPAQLEVIKELTNKLIDKISVIEIKQQQYD